MSTEHKALATRLHFAAVHLLRRLRREDAGSGLSTTELSAISTLVNRGSMTLSELAAAEQVRPPTITRLVQRLEAAGYVIRETPMRDGRISMVRHTTKAWVALEKTASDRAAALSGALDGLDPDEITALLRGVELIERLVRDSPGAGRSQPSDA